MVAGTHDKNLDINENDLWMSTAYNWVRLVAFSPDSEVMANRLVG